MTNEQLHSEYAWWIESIVTAMKRTYQLDEDEIENLRSKALDDLFSLPQDKRLHIGYVKRTCTNACRCELRSIRKNRKRNNKTVSYDAPLNESGIFADILPDPADVEAGVLNKMLSTQFLATLNETEQRIMRLVFGFGTEPHSHSEIAGKVGLSRNRVGEIIKDCLGRMRSATEPTSQYKMHCCKCSVCGEIETLLLPLNLPLPQTTICLNCDVLTPFEVLPNPSTGCDNPCNC